MQIFALCDIEPYVECLAPYGEGWWAEQSPKVSVSKRKKRLISVPEYEILHKAYEDTILSLFV